MLVVTTSSKDGLKEYAHRWLDSRKNWPEGTDFRFYTEGFEVDCPSKDLRDVPDLADFKMKHASYVPPSWQWDVVKFCYKVFAAYDAFRDYKGIGVWLDADCVTYKKIPDGLIESKVKDAYLACYQRTGLYTETGLWVMDCSHPEHGNFLDFWKSLYMNGRFSELPHWHDCLTLDATIRVFADKVKIHNLSGEFHKSAHPQALSDLGEYIDHCKGPRKKAGSSPENKHRG